VAEHGQLPRPGDLGVLLAQRPRGGVAGVGVDLFPLLGHLPVERLEPRGGEEDLPPDLEGGRRVVEGEALGDVGDGAHVGGDVVADHAVAAGRGPDQAAPLVLEGDGHPVDLELADIGGDLDDDALGAPAPGGQLLGGERVVERQHRHPVAHRGERPGLDGADGLGGRVVGAQVGVVLLQPLQLAEQLVVLGVGDVGVAEHVVAVERVAQPRP
jgi:hypothetical protein